MDDVFIYVIDLPDGIAECVLPCVDGYTVYINARLSKTKQLEAYRHATVHIRNNDWNNSDIHLIEKEAHKKREPSLPERFPQPQRADTNILYPFVDFSCKG